MWTHTLSHIRLLDPVDCISPGSSVHGTSQARILEWVAISSSRGSSRPRDQIRISCCSCMGRQILYRSAPWEALYSIISFSFLKPICKDNFPSFPVAAITRACSVALAVSDSLRPHGLQPARPLCPWDSPGKNTGVGFHALLQGISLTRDWIRVSCFAGRFLPLSPQGSPTAIINYCKLGALKQQKYIGSNFWKPELWSRVSAGLVSSGSPEEESVASVLASGGCLGNRCWSSVWRCSSPVSASVFTQHSLCVPSPNLLRTSFMEPGADFIKSDLILSNDVLCKAYDQVRSHSDVSYSDVTHLRSPQSEVPVAANLVADTIQHVTDEWMIEKNNWPGTP